MARKKSKDAEQPSKPAKSSSSQTTQKIDQELNWKAGMIARKRKIAIHKYLDSLIRDPIERDYEQEFGK